MSQNREGLEAWRRGTAEEEEIIISVAGDFEGKALPSLVEK
jgi:hypothetical protein